MPPSELARVHHGHAEFEHWPVAAIRVLRAMAEGKPMLTEDVQRRSAELGEPITYSTARGGIRYLMGDRWSDRGSLAREWGSGPPKAQAVQQLNAAGVKRANLSLRIYSPRPRAEGAPEQSTPATTSPPDPITPLWRVLTDTAEVLVIAADAPAAIALYEQETGENAHRAVAVGTEAPLVLTWTAKPRQSD